MYKLPCQLLSIFSSSTCYQLFVQLCLNFFAFISQLVLNLFSQHCHNFVQLFSKPYGHDMAQEIWHYQTTPPTPQHLKFNFQFFWTSNALKIIKIWPRHPPLGSYAHIAFFISAASILYAKFIMICTFSSMSFVLQYGTGPTRHRDKLLSSPKMTKIPTKKSESLLQSPEVAFENTQWRKIV